MVTMLRRLSVVLSSSSLVVKRSLSAGSAQFDPKLGDIWIYKVVFRETESWAALLKDIKEKDQSSDSATADAFAVDLTGPPSSSSSSSPSSTHAASSSFLQDFNLLSPSSRDNHELELDFKRLWEEFRNSSSEKEKEAALDVEKVLRFFSDVTKDGFSPGANLLTAVEVLVSGPIDKQSLLDSGIFLLSNTCSQCVTVLSI